MNQLKAIELQPQIFNLKGWVELTNPEQLRPAFEELLTESGFKVLNFSEQSFPLNGYTAMWLLAESHLALHTFAHSGWSYIELSSCNKDKAEQFLQLSTKLNVAVKWDAGIESLVCTDQQTKQSC